VFSKIVAYVRQHVLAALALVCSLLSLAGASYAAFSLPAGSVGARELKTGAITAAKLNPTSVAASIRAWATLTWAGAWRVQASSSDIKVLSASSGEIISWRHTRFARNCIASVTPTVNFPAPGGSSAVNGFVTTFFNGPAGQLQVSGLTSDGTRQIQDVNVLIVCPSPGSQKVNR
jgi:hypothetical protein